MLRGCLPVNKKNPVEVTFGCGLFASNRTKHNESSIGGNLAIKGGLQNSAALLSQLAGFSNRGPVGPKLLLKKIDSITGRHSNQS